jgi:hypothetical protein
VKSPRRPELQAREEVEKKKKKMESRVSNKGRKRSGGSGSISRRAAAL